MASLGQECQPAFGPPRHLQVAYLAGVVEPLVKVSVESETAVGYQLLVDCSPVPDRYLVGELLLEEFPVVPLEGVD